MASWVSPAIAADMWNMTVPEILARAHRGELQTKQEGPFTFVNIDSSIEGNVETPARLTPPTFSVLTDEEVSSLLEPIEYRNARKIVATTRKGPIAA